MSRAGFGLSDPYFGVASASLILLAASGASAANSGYGIAGPFRVIAEHVLECPPGHLDAPFWATFKMRRDRTQISVFYLTANASFPVTLNDSIDLMIDAASWSSRGGWKDHAYHLRFHRVCSAALTYFPGTFRRIMKHAFNDTNRKCPFAPGIYWVTDISTDFDKEVRGIPAFFYGRYRADAHLVHGPTNRRVACARGIGSVVPKYVTSGQAG